MLPIKVLIVADDPLVRAGLTSLLSQANGISVAGSSGLVVFENHDIDLFQPDLILVDLGPNQKSFSSLIPNFPGEIPVLIMAEGYPAQLRFGSPTIRGFLNRDGDPSRLGAAIQAAAFGLFVSDFQSQNSNSYLDLSEEVLPLEALTPREIEVLNWMVEGLPNKSIASHLSISEHTVKFHINSILEKLNAQSRTDAVVRATRLGIIQL